MSDFWNKKNNPALQESTMLVDEEMVEKLQENLEFDSFEEEEDTKNIMQDASLRLQQGHLYQLVLQGDIFADTNADPRAIRNVQREISKFVRDRMEIMLGIKQEQVPMAPTVSSLINDLEVLVIKTMASRFSKGATEEPHQLPTIQGQSTPKKDGITSINGNLNHGIKNSINISEKQDKIKSAPILKKNIAKPISAINSKSEETALIKPIDQMSPEELLAYNKLAEERSKQKYAQLPTNMEPHPTAQGLEILYTQAAQNTVIANPWRTGQ